MSILDKLRKPNSRKKGLKILVYGPTGVGKTMFSLSFPKIVYIDTEDGAGWYEGTEQSKNLLNVLDTQSYADLEELLDNLEDSDVEGEFDTFVVDSETKIYENIQEALQSVEESRAARKGRDVLDANLSVRSWGKIKQLASRLQNAKIRLASQGVNVVSVAQESDVMKDAGKNVRVKVGEKPNMSKTAPYDYDVILRLFIRDGKYYGVIEKDRTNTLKLGTEVENPSYDLWAKRLNAKDNQGKSIAKDFGKDAEKSQKAYAKEVESNMSFADRVKEYLTKLDSDGRKAFAQEMVDATGTMKVNQMNAEQQKKVLALIEEHGA